jgi:hypothetical protein
LKVSKGLDSWVQAMKKTEASRRVIQNLVAEVNVPAKLGTSFFSDLAKRYDGSKRPAEHMNAVLASKEKYGLGGPKRNLELELLTRFARLARLADHPDLKKGGISFQRLLKKPDLIGRLRAMRLGNRRGIVWAARETPVGKDLLESDISKVLDKLGLTDRFEEPWCQITYSSGDFPGPCNVPTVLDAGADPRFRPSAKDADSGITAPCSLKGQGYPEYVHKACDVDRPGLKAFIV